MKFYDWLKPGIRIKRWIFLGICGLVCISYGLSFMLKHIFHSVLEYVLSGLLIISGFIFIAISIKYIFNTLYNLISISNFKISLDSEKLSDLLYEQRILIKGPKVVSM